MPPSAPPPRRPPAAPPTPAAAAPASAPERPELLATLLAQKAVTPEQAERARRAARLGNVSVEHALLQGGLATEVQIAQAVAAHAGLPFARLNPLDLDLDVVTGALSGPFARRHGIVAISKANGVLTVAVHDPWAPFPADEIKQKTGLELRRVVATRSDIEAVNKGFYDLKTSLTTAQKQLESSRVSNVDLGNQEFLSASTDELDPAAAPVVRALDHMLTYAFEQRASDIHFEPKRELTLVRLRIDGVLHDVHVIPKIVYQALVSRIKLLSGCNIAEKRRPQDGRIKREQGGREVELRVSTMPTAFGEKAVLRIFDPDILLKGVDELGLSPRDLPRFYEFIARTDGILLVTGPTGSGKTTTLYSILKYLSRPEVNIVTIEDPIEMVHEDFNQVAVRPQIDVTFANALRTVLRQDPDVIMVGEIRDAETAEHAVQAALTGHLVFSTLHTNDAPSSVNRLLDLGVPHFLITSTLIGVLAQRLMRVNCAHCSEQHAPTREEAAELALPEDAMTGVLFRAGRGCLECRQTGYSGRDGIYEVMAMTERLRQLVTDRAGANEIHKAARAEGLRTLREAGVEKVFRGTTTVAELVRVTGRAH
ncbi:MAG: Flp pilus assembly complex ATPase component TadA [Vicinamibacteria bacterium]|nr:Flp pilus assembly complex ATPase component TadA [Vicinamibacteria bacterium]